MEKTQSRQTKATLIWKTDFSSIFTTGSRLDQRCIIAKMTQKTGKNRYLKNARILDTQFRSILKEFSFDSTASETAERTGIGRKTVNRIFHLIRKRLAVLCEKESKFSGEIEIEESYFGAKRVRGKRGRGAKGKIPVIGLLKRNGTVYSKPVRNCTRTQLMPVIKGKILERKYNTYRWLDKLRRTHIKRIQTQESVSLKG